MKRGLLLKIIERYGAVFVRHGKKHDIYLNPRTGKLDQVPSHSNIEENLAKKIIKMFMK